MCDYSLHAISNRLAVEGERLVVHRFKTGTIGLAPASVTFGAASRAKPPLWRKLLGMETESDQPVCAVCIPPGASLRLHDLPMRLRREIQVDEIESVTFTQTTAHEYTYRDAVRFRNGQVLLLQRLEPGQIIEVLSLASPERTQEELPAAEAAVPQRV